MFRICWFLLCTFPVLWWLIAPVVGLCAVAQLNVYYKMFPQRAERIRQDEVRAAGLAARGQEDRNWASWQ